MEIIIIIIATLLGGISAIIYFWEKISGWIKKIFGEEVKRDGRVLYSKDDILRGKDHSFTS